MPIRIWFSSLRHRPMMPLLVLLQVAVACAILCNVALLIWQELQPMVVPTGMDTANLILVDHLQKAHGEWSARQVQGATDALLRVPGVRVVSATGGDQPLEGGINVVSLRGPTGATVGINYYAAKGLVKTLGLDLVKGRDFRASEYTKDHQNKDALSPIIITESLAHQLFGTDTALGGVIRFPGARGFAGWQVVGVVRHLLRRQIDLATDGRADDMALMPAEIGKTATLGYIIRVDPRMHRVAIGGVRRTLKSLFGASLEIGIAPRVEFYDSLLAVRFRSRRATLYLFIGVAAIVLIVTVIGIMGLTGFWIQRRTREIGIRRALGARRVDILGYFLGENVTIVVIGSLLGVLLAYAGNLTMMHYYSLPRLPLWYLPVGALAMLFISQIAVLSPALRAARIPPVAAIRAS